MGKIRANNLGIICHATASFFINYSFTDAPGSQINFSRRQTDIPTTQWNTQQCVLCESHVSQASSVSGCHFQKFSLSAKRINFAPLYEYTCLKSMVGL